MSKDRPFKNASNDQNSEYLHGQERAKPQPTPSSETDNVQKQSEIDFLERKLLTQETLIIQKNNAFKNIYDSLNKMISQVDVIQKDQLEEIARKVKQNISSGEERENFKIYFQNIHPIFYDGLSNEYPLLTQNELRHCAFIRLNMSSKEISKLLNITPKSVAMAHYRIRRKLDLKPYSNLFEVIKKF